MTSWWKSETTRRSFWSRVLMCALLTADTGLCCTKCCKAGGRGTFEAALPAPGLRPILSILREASLLLPRARLPLPFAWAECPPPSSTCQGPRTCHLASASQHGHRQDGPPAAAAPAPLPQCAGPAPWPHSPAAAWPAPPPSPPPLPTLQRTSPYRERRGDTSSSVLSLATPESVPDHRTLQGQHLCQPLLCLSKDSQSMDHKSLSGLRSTCRWEPEKRSPSSASFFSLVSLKCCCTLQRQHRATVTSRSMTSGDCAGSLAEGPCGSPKRPSKSQQRGRDKGSPLVPACFGGWS